MAIEREAPCGAIGAGVPREGAVHEGKLLVVESDIVCLAQEVFRGAPHGMVRDALRATHADQ